MSAPAATAPTVFVDLNQTLVRTGQVALEERLREQRELEELRELCARIAGRWGLRLVFLTGNSFEYSRRIEEPLGLKNLEGLRLTVVSENGLLGRDFRQGDLWRARPTGRYLELVNELAERASAHPALAGRFYTQGNEVRVTFKPVANELAEDELAAFVEVGESLGLAEEALVYTHRFYVDVDPLEVELDGERHRPFAGKGYAVRRLADPAARCLVAIGDSTSDVPMFEAVRALGGTSYLVENAPSEVPGGESVRRIPGRFTAGVNRVLRGLVVEGSSIQDPGCGSAG